MYIICDIILSTMFVVNDFYKWCICVDTTHWVLINQAEPRIKLSIIIRRYLQQLQHFSDFTTFTIWQLTTCQACGHSDLVIDIFQCITYPALNITVIFFKKQWGCPTNSFLLIPDTNNNMRRKYQYLVRVSVWI